MASSAVVRQASTATDRSLVRRPALISALLAPVGDAPTRVFMAIMFLLTAAWPLLGMRRGPRYPWIIRPIGAIPSQLAGFIW